MSKCGHKIEINKWHELYLNQNYGVGIKDWLDRYGFCDECLGIIEIKNELYDARYNFGRYSKSENRFWEVDWIEVGINHLKTIFPSETDYVVRVFDTGGTIKDCEIQTKLPLEEAHHLLEEFDSWWLENNGSVGITFTLKFL